jgi:succinate dehydrogenase / fumarate reductase membrane anchor subunit
MSGYRTPRSRAAGLGAAKEGVHTWIAERVTSIALAPLSLWAVYAALRVAPLGYDSAVLWIQQPLNTLLALLFTVVGYYHMGLGVRVVIEDYIHKRSTLVALLLANTFLWWVMGLATVVALLKIALGIQVGALV